MHWGIRRFQPYSIGYQRKGGEKGKFNPGSGSEASSNDTKKTSYPSAITNHEVPLKLRYEYGDPEGDPEAKYHSEHSANAYKNTVKYYQKYEPEKLKEYANIIKKAGSDDLREIHDFRKMYEGFQDDEPSYEHAARVDSAETKYDALAKEYKESKSSNDLNKLNDSDLYNEINKSAGNYYDNKPVGEHSKAAYELYNAVNEQANAIEERIETQQKHITDLAKKQAVEKFPKLLRNSEYAKSAASAAARKAEQNDEHYKDLEKERKKASMENSAKKYAAQYKIVSAALRDMGYPVNDENIKKIWDLVITD